MNSHGVMIYSSPVPGDFGVRRLDAAFKLRGAKKRIASHKSSARTGARGQSSLYEKLRSNMSVAMTHENGILPFSNSLIG